MTNCRFHDYCMLLTSIRLSLQALADTDSIRAKSELYVPYNILPLDQGGFQHAIMQLPEV